MATLLEIQHSSRLFGQQLAHKAIDLVGEKNLMLEAAGTPANTAELLTSIGLIKELLAIGSLKTARTYCVALAPSYPTYESIFNLIAESVTDFMVGGGYEEEEEDV